MYTTYHFDSVKDIDDNVLKAIQLAFKGKSISITIKEEPELEGRFPDWHRDLALEEKRKLENGETKLRDWTAVKDSFQLEN